MSGRTRRGFWFITAIAASALCAWAFEASAGKCVPNPSSQGMRDCDAYNPQCPSDGRSANFYNDKEAHEYLRDLDDAVDGTSGEYLAVMPLGAPRFLELQLGEAASGMKVDPEIEMLAVRVTQDANDRDVTKPTILLTAGVHAQEWIAQDTALGLVDWLVRAANGRAPYNDPAEVARVRVLLAEREIWFVVISNPVGREVEVEKDDNWGTPVYSDVRKSRQWEPGFECIQGWESAPYGGRCWYEDAPIVTGFPRDDRPGISEWDEPGVNIGNSFSHGWERRGSEPFRRRLIYDETELSVEFDLAPEQYNCFDSEPAQADFNCLRLFGEEHGHCVEHWMGAYEYVNGVKTRRYTYGCFMTTATNTLLDCQSQIAPGKIDGRGFLHEHCVPIENSSGTQWALWECGDSADFIHEDPPGANDAYVDCGTSPAPPQCPSSVPTPMLSYCLNGTLRTCSTDASCHPTIRSQEDFQTSSMNDGFKTVQAPHWIAEAEMADHLYCYKGYCAIDNRRTCCSNQYGGQRPFESIEARLIRELVINVPFRAVVDMHSSRNDLKFRCTNKGDGCDPDDDFFENGQALEAEMTAAYNTTAEAHWNGHAWGSLGGFPDFLELATTNESTRGEGFGYLAGWTSGMPETTDPNAYAEPDNFDNDTIRALPSFTWELGTRESVDDDEQATFNTIVGCYDPDDQHSGQPRSRLMLENQLAGGIAMMEYLAWQSGTPAVGLTQSGMPLLTGNRRDVAVSGLRVEDGHGRGVQQSETGGGTSGTTDLGAALGADDEARIVVPAGRWEVSADVQAGWSGGTVPPPSPLSADVSLVQRRYEPSGKDAWPIVDEVQFVESINAREWRRVRTRFDFEAGKRYRIETKINNIPGTVDNDTAANDLQVLKADVLDCTDEAELPNSLDPDLFCEKGLPFADEHFECDDAKGTCRECWYDVGYQYECEGEGTFCFEGMCDSYEECWSGTFVDELEGAAGNETSPTITPDEPPFVRTLRMENSSGVLIQDVDTFKTATTYSHATGYSPPTMYHLKVIVWNLCEGGLYFPGAYVSGLDVRVQVRKPWATYPYVDDDDYFNLTSPTTEGWTTIERVNGLDLDIPAGWAAGVNSDKYFRIQVRNREAALESIPYSLDIEMDDVGGFNGMLYPMTEVQPWDEVVWPTADVNVDMAAGEVRSFVPTDDGMWGGYLLFFSPAAGYENAVGVTQFLLSTQDGGIPSDPNGVPLAPTVNRDGGLAVQLGALDPRSGPYEVRLATDAERIEGRVFLCGPNVADCSVYSPRTDACGPACTGDGALCCADEDRNLSCKYVHGSDVTNCGGCGVTCDWDEKCLKGVCVTGRTTSCWNTTCPEGMECVSRDWPLLRNPQCRATLVDNAWCGLLGDVCAENESCTYGLCLPKMFSPCDLPCGDGEACCWVMGEETCVDVQGSSLNCGACGNVCDAGTLCKEGLCESWYHVLDVCAGEGIVNCGVDGIDCQDVLWNHENCGSCGIACSDTGECRDGVCIDILEADAYGAGEEEE
ncbi:MAG: hypothetical protein M0R80_14615 [Proteobacteria bacterium]|jgi:hypothetical protein|nr:hypothetical protein [Pseudomonadota bacterium]